MENKRRNNRGVERFKQGENVGVKNMRGQKKGCLSYYSNAVKRRHGQGNYYKRKRLIGGLLIVFRVESIIAIVGAWKHAGRPDSGEVAESSFIIRQSEP